MMAISMIKPVRLRPTTPRGVRAALQPAEIHGWRAIRLVPRGETPVTLGAAIAMAYLAIRRRGVASSAMTSVMMFIST
jgi:hypothetical protein